MANTFIGRRFTAMLSGSISIALMVGLAISRWGMPVDASTWVVLAIAVAMGVTAGIASIRNYVFTLVMLFAIYLVIPVTFDNYLRTSQTNALYDKRGGRMGMELGSLRFGHAGPNTVLLESYVGPLAPHWIVAYPCSSNIRDGNERVHFPSIVRSPSLVLMLDMLPTEAARKQVVTCLTDTDNLLRIHQGLLLACVYTFGFPEGYNAESWWRFHSNLFRRFDDPKVAAKTIYGWTAVMMFYPTDDQTYEFTAQLNCARYQERGNWGGDRRLGDEFEKLGIHVLVIKAPISMEQHFPTNVAWHSLKELRRRSKDQ